uniref:Protein BOBBER 1 isoform X2 n=1 Tax=Rhizophora mucronata TaxID=61149 RepID=A0A2P2JRX4_RHIMU
MAIISDYEEDKNETKPASAGSSSSAPSFNATFDPSNPIGIVEALMDFVAIESDFLLKDKAEQEIVAVVRAAKEKEKKKKQKKLDAEKREKEAAAAAASSATKKPESEEPKGKKQPMEVEKEAKNGASVPNKGNGLDLEKYSWTQTLQEVNIHVPVPSGTKSRFVVCDIKKNNLKVGLKGQPPIIDGELYKPIKVDDCYWSIGMSTLWISFIRTKN